MAEEARPRLVKDILSCYIDTPNLVESTEGLARWRLLEQYVEETTRETEKALAWLVERGFLREVTPGSSTRRMFMLNMDRLDEAQTFLTAAKEEPHGRG
jgi:hypothetical protein